MLHYKLALLGAWLDERGAKELLHPTTCRSRSRVGSPLIHSVTMNFLCSLSDFGKTVSAVQLCISWFQVDYSKSLIYVTRTNGKGMRAYSEITHAVTTGGRCCTCGSERRADVMAAILKP